MTSDADRPRGERPDGSGRDTPRRAARSNGAALVVCVLIMAGAGWAKDELTLLEPLPSAGDASARQGDYTAVGVDAVESSPVRVRWPATPLTGRFLADGRVPRSQAARGLDGVAEDCEPTGVLRGFWVPEDASGLLGPVWYDFGGTGRGFYRNNQRIEFTGQEESFGVEGSLRGLIGQDVGSVRTALVAEMFLNQPFDRNVLVDTPDRRGFHDNFIIEPFEISQLHVSAQQGAGRVTLGRFATPFGRTYFPLFGNGLEDAPFIRTEAIAWRETGLLLEYEPSDLRAALALTNGGDGRDTNSSKALVGRVGGDWGTFVSGASFKIQDGIGSEQQKVYNNHIGLDAAVRRGTYTLSAEVIYDQYGLRRPFPIEEIYWGRSLYHRDINRGHLVPLDGVGWYVDLTRDGRYWQWSASLGAFHPRPVGDRIHDTPTTRGVLKAARRLTPSVDVFTVLLLENSIGNTFDGRVRRGVDVTFGMQWVLP